MLDSLGNSVMVDSPDCAFDQVARGLNIVSTIDFFYPLVDDPYNQGRIGAANVLSDLFSCGITEIRSVLMILSASTQMSKPHQLIVTRLMIQGFADAVREAKSRVVGGQSVMNEFPMIGGAAIGLSRELEPYVPRNAKPGDVLLLTKPLGSQILVNVNQYYKNDDEKWKKLSLEKRLISGDKIEELYEKGVEWLGQLNDVPARLMLKHGATSSTDVTGFGILGHSQNLAELQREEVDFIIESLPAYSVLPSLDGVVRDFKFKAGLAAETSGGLLISFPEERVEGFVKEMEEAGREVWRVGRVIKGSRKAVVRDGVNVIEVV